MSHQSDSTFTYNRSHEVTTHWTATARTHVIGQTAVAKATHNVLEEMTTLTTMNVGRILEALFAKERFIVARDTDSKLLAVDVILPCRKDKHEAARTIISPDRPKRQKKQDPSGLPKKASSASQPIYPNSYHIVEVISTEGKNFGEKDMFLRVRVFEAWLDAEADNRRKISEINAQVLAAAIGTYMETPPLGKMFREPVFKQAAEMFLSHVGLLEEGDQTSGYPVVATRRPEERELEWRKSLETIAARTEPFEYARARDIEHYREDDPRGNRRVNVSKDWLGFSKTPFQPSLAIKILPKHVKLWHRRTQTDRQIIDRLYMQLPVFDGAPADSRLARLAENDKLFWWHRHMEEFTIVGRQQTGSTLSRKLTADKKSVLIAMEYDRGGRFEEAITGPFRNVALVTIAERKVSHPDRKGFSRNEHYSGRKLGSPGNKTWQTNVATSLEFVANMPHRVMGIHFGVTPVIKWVVVEGDESQGSPADVAKMKIVGSGTIEGNPILETAQAEKDKLEKIQARHAWTGDRRFRHHIKQETERLAREIVDIAFANDAAISLEEISFVPNKGSDAMANRRFTLWNYSALASKIEWLGTDLAVRLESGVADLEADRPTQTAPVIRKVSSFRTRFTCPRCRACRGKDDTITRREGDILHCSACRFSGPIPGDSIAELAAMEGLTALGKIEARLAKKQ